MLVFPVWVSKVKYLCIVCLLCHLISLLNIYSSLMLGLAWKCSSFPNIKSLVRVACGLDVKLKFVCVFAD
jgi:hypothetical protein